MPARIDPKPASATTFHGFVRMGQGYVLLADDDASSAAALSAMAYECGYGCDVVRNGLDAQRAFRVRDYDAILLNLLSSFNPVSEVVTGIRRLERNYPEPKVPVVLFSAGLSQVERDEAGKSREYEAVLRPRSVEEMRELLTRIVVGHRRTPSGKIPREPINYHALLEFCAMDSAKVARMIDQFAGELTTAVEKLQVEIDGGRVEGVQTLAALIRDLALQNASPRINRTALLLSRITNPADLGGWGRELHRELLDAVGDLGAWIELRLGQSAPGVHVKPKVTPTQVMRLTSFLRGRVDIFSKIPAPGQSS